MLTIQNIFHIRICDVSYLCYGQCCVCKVFCQRHQLFQKTIFCLIHTSGLKEQVFPDVCARTHLTGSLAGRHGVKRNKHNERYGANKHSSLNNNPPFQRQTSNQLSLVLTFNFTLVIGLRDCLPSLYY